MVNDLGVAPDDVSKNVSLLYGGEQTDVDFNASDGLYPIMLSLSALDRRDLSALHLLKVRSSTTGKLIPIAQLVYAKEVASSIALSHYNRLPSTLIKADLKPGYSMGQAIEHMGKITSAALPSNMQYTWSGLTKQYLNTNYRMQFLIVLALLLIYLVLTLQFKSFKDPFIIILTVPLTFLGASMALWLVGASLNLYTEVGLLTLIGLITKHGILIIDFAKLSLVGGETPWKAAQVACSKRFRPILMTTLAMILGALPLALSHGEGTAGLSQIGWTIVGGMFFGTLSSLFVVPVLFALLTKVPVRDA